jgi:hypothetical protein
MSVSYEFMSRDCSWLTAQYSRLTAHIRYGPTVAT